MALIKCPECGGQISDKAPACIHCGYPLQEATTSNVAQNIIVKVNGQSYDISDLKKMYDKYTDAEQKMICNTCSQLYNNWYKSSSNNKRFSGKGENLIQWIGTTFNWWPKNHMNYIAYKFLAECRMYNFRYFEFNTDKYVKQVSKQSQPIYSPSASQNVVRCPRCGSTSVTTEEKGYGFFGWIGASQKKNLCQKCGHKWWPGR